MPMLPARRRRPDTLLVGAALASAGVVGAAWLLDARRRERQGRAMHRTLVELLLNALTADDPSTGRHSRRVADLSYALAAARGLRGRDMARLRVAALFHDMGKMEERFEDLVRAPRELTDGEREEMQEHPHESAAIVGPLETLHPGIARIVAAHHERWDGEGYPEGLAGRSIPLEARIIAIADVFDALSQPRPYHAARPVEEVLDEIRRSAGTQFDPALVTLASTPTVIARWRAIAHDGRKAESAAHQRQ